MGGGQAHADGDGIAQVLRAAGLTITAPRRAVYRLLFGRERPVGAGEVFDLLRADGSRLGITSVYRVLHSFAGAGLVHVFAGEEQRYRICDPVPHAHLVCEECGRVIERPADTVRQWLSAARHDADFVANVERSDVYGLCGRCRPGSHVGPTPSASTVGDTP
ncbi:Fur family transcriptional regulator [Rugosimonospora africana]|uniref:Peroxide-responsive transcriptional repressor PerR n=1 Tax=Rugosimonospora africana TaxID=556532 RepID=A0A8J3R296_9ACTN|nr:Fur family transcriptional regulator [Rugosimonospora africana]GIH20207.1 peroxide-responsive transcriptional repressor PerR [Rugosimonospora africana]